MSKKYHTGWWKSEEEEEEEGWQCPLERRGYKCTAFCDSMTRSRCWMEYPMWRSGYGDLWGS